MVEDGQRAASPVTPAGDPKAAARSRLADPAAPWALSTYLAEGLPYSIVHQVLGQQYFTAVNVSPELLGLASLLHLPWNLKFVWAPLVDRYGSARAWMSAAQGLLALLTIAAAWAAHADGPQSVAWILVGMAVLAATNDIAIDAYYVRSLDKERQAKLSGLRIAAFRAAMLLGSGPIVTLAGLHGFPAALLVLAALLAVSALAHRALLRRDAIEVDPHESTLSTALEAAKAFFRQPGIALSLVLLLTYRAGDALLFAMNAKFLSSLGLDTATRGVVNGTFGTAASILGSIVGGVIIARASFKRAFVPITLLQSGALLLYAALAYSGVRWEAGANGALVIGAVVVAEQLIAGIGTAAFTVFLLRLANGPHKATHFAFASSLMSLAVTFSGSASGFLFQALGAPLYFVAAFAASLPGVLAAFAATRSAK